MAWRAINTLMALMFLFSVVVQYNDPDPVQWMAIYGAGCVCSAAAVMRKRWFAGPLVVGITALLWAAVLSLGVLGKVQLGELLESFEMKDARVEQAREMGGLVIVASWMFVIAVVQRARRVQTAPSPALS